MRAIGRKVENSNNIMRLLLGFGFGGISSASSDSTASITPGFFGPVGQAEAETDSFVFGNGIAVADAEATVKTHYCYLNTKADTKAIVKYWCGKVIADAHADALGVGVFPITYVTTWAKAKKCAALATAEGAAKAFFCY